MTSVTIFNKRNNFSTNEALTENHDGQKQATLTATGHHTLQSSHCNNIARRVCFQESVWQRHAEGVWCCSQFISVRVMWSFICYESTAHRLFVTLVCGHPSRSSRLPNKCLGEQKNYSRQTALQDTVQSLKWIIKYKIYQTVGPKLWRVVSKLII